MFCSTTLMWLVCLHRDPVHSWLMLLPWRSTTIGLRVVVPPFWWQASAETNLPAPANPVASRTSSQVELAGTKHCPVVRHLRMGVCAQDCRLPSYGLWHWHMPWVVGSSSSSSSMVLRSSMVVGTCVVILVVLKVLRLAILRANKEKWRYCKKDGGSESQEGFDWKWLGLKFYGLTASNYTWVSTR